MRNIAVLIILVVAFYITELTLTYFLPLAKTDFDVWLKYFIAKDAVYDAMFFLLFLLVFWMARTKGEKAVSAFAVIVSGGSFVDKVIFSLNQYLTSDVILTLMALAVSISIYRRYGRFHDLGH